LGEDREGMRADLGAISLLVGPPGGDSSLPPPLGLVGASGWLLLLLAEEPMLILAALLCWWALEELELEGVDDTRERKLGITRCLQSRHKHNQALVRNVPLEFALELKLKASS